MVHTNTDDTIREQRCHAPHRLISTRAGLASQCRLYPRDTKTSASMSQSQSPYRATLLVLARSYRDGIIVQG